MFEEEYDDIVGSMQREFGDDEHISYLDSIKTHDTHAGYFSIDKKANDRQPTVRQKEGLSDDIDAYDLIMKIRSCFWTAIRRGLRCASSSHSRCAKAGIT